MHATISIAQLLVLMHLCGSTGQGLSKDRLLGQVLDSLSLKPIAGATVTLPGTGKGVLTDSTGMFRFTDLRPGDYDIAIFMIGYRHTFLVVQLPEEKVLRVLLAPEEILLPGIEVRGEMESGTTTKSVTMLAPAEVERHRGQTLGQTLENLPGVSLLSTGPSIAKPVLGGFHSQRLLVMHAGLQQEGQQWGGEHAPEIDPFAISSMKIVRGVESVRYGPGAIGGVIVVEPRPLIHANMIDGEVQMNVFSNNRQLSGAIMLEGGIASHWGWRAQGSGRKAGDAMTSSGRLANTGFREMNGSAAVGYSRGKIETDLYVSRFATELGMYKGSHVGNVTDLQRILRGEIQPDYSEFSYTIQPPRQEIVHDLVSLGARYSLHEGGTIATKLGYQRNDRREFDAHRTFNDPHDVRPSFELTLDTYTGEAAYTHRPGSGFVTEFGINALQQTNVRAGSVFLIPNYRTYAAGAFLMETLSLDEWTLTAGIRYDYRWMKVFPVNFRGIDERVHLYRNLSLAAGVLFELSADWSFGTHVGTAWRPPTVNELYSNDVHHGAAQFEIGDRALESERTFSTDATLRHTAARSRGELSVHTNFFENYIFLQPLLTPTLTVRGAFPTFRHMQAPVVIVGVDGMVEWDVTGSYRLRLSGSVVRGKNRESSDYLMFLPSDRVHLQHHFHFTSSTTIIDPYCEISFTLVRRQGHVPEGADYAAPPAGYTLVGLDLGSDILVVGRPLHLAMSIRNLFNVRYRDYLSRYRYFVDDPGRDIILRLRIALGNFH